MTPAHLVPVPDAGRTVYRVETASGPLRECRMCGLYAWPAAAVEHAARHGVRVELEPAAEAARRSL